MATRIKERQDCRHYVVELDTASMELHFELVQEFLKRGVHSPRSGGCGPVEGKPGWSWHVFSLALGVADEYERRMGSCWAPGGA